MLFVPPGIPFMVPEAEAAYGEVPNPVTDLTITHPPGTIIEWDLDYNALCSVHNVCPSSFHELQIYVNKYVMTGNQEFLCFFQEDATPTTTCDPGMFQLVRQGNWDYKLYVNTGTAAANGNVLAEGLHRLTVELKTTPTNTITGSSDFTLASSDTTPPAVLLDSPTTPILTTTNSTGFQAFIQLSYNLRSAFTTYYTNATDTSVSTNHGNGIWFKVSATDDVSVSSQLTPVCTPGVITPPSFDPFHLTTATSTLFPIGVTTVTCTATDAAGNTGTTSFPVTVVLEEGDTTPPAETPAIIFGNKHYNLDSSQYQLAHEFTGNTPKIWITFNDWVPITGSNTGIVAVFPNAQNGLPLHCPNISHSQCLSIPYTLTYPGGVEQGVLEYINTTDHYDMGLSFTPTVAGHYVFQTELISTSFDVYDLSTAAGQQAAADAEEEANSQAEIITMDIINQSDNKFIINESFTIQGHWQNPTSNTVFIRVQATNSGVITWTDYLSLDQNNNFTTTINVADVATHGVVGGGYLLSACASSATCNYDTYSREQFWLIEQDTNASIILTADKTTLDRSISNDIATITVTYQNLNPVANWIIKTPDGVEHNIGASFSTNAFPGTFTFNFHGLGNYCSIICPFDSIVVIVDVGATRGEITIQIINQPVEPSITASAYLNSTSSTGRTFALTATNLDPSLYPGASSVYIDNTVWKDGVGVLSWPSWGGWDFDVDANFSMNHMHYPDGTFQAQIPEDWEAGTYQVQHVIHVGGNVTHPSPTTFTVPALPVTAAEGVATFLDNNTIEGIDQLPEGPIMECCPWLYGSYQGAVYWQQHLRPFILEVNEPITALELLTEEFQTQCRAVQDVRDSIPVYNSDGTANEEHEIAVLNQELYCSVENWAGYTLNLINEGMSVQSAINVQDEYAEDIVSEYLDIVGEIVIPSWIKKNAEWWASDQIDDRAFVTGLQWLISNGIMHIPPTEQGVGSDNVIPGWIKNNAGWWADDLIDDRNFVGGIQWLITNGIMIIELE